MDNIGKEAPSSTNDDPSLNSAIGPARPFSLQALFNRVQRLHGCGVLTLVAKCWSRKELTEKSKF